MTSGGTVNAKACLRRAGWLVAAALITICLLPVYSHSSPALLLDSDRQFQFAEDLFQRGEYYRAIGEYERFIHFFPESEEVVLARYRIGLAYLKGERYEEAIEAFELVASQYPESTYADQSYLRMSEAYVQVKRYDDTIMHLEKLVAMTHDQNIKDEAHYQCGWVYLEQGLWDDAEACFNQISSENRARFRIENLFRELDKRRDLKRKNPTTAGMLAIVPGAGHVYCERYRDALLAFLVNGALILAAWEAFDHELYALGGLIAVVEIGFYSGNIYSAVGSAHKYNREEKNRFLRYLEERGKVKISLAGPGHDEA
ncbi:MAG: tetratricopeptide repeat protein, partial [Deltaproteobacteria bacterium]|nr:tetratricopeptide repeat protein [Deltaproteobacteria bacterium]